MDVAARGGTAFRDVPYMGVIYLVAEAMKPGFRNGDPDWCNLGQGQPEVGPMEAAPIRKHARYAKYLHASTGSCAMDFWVLACA